MTLLHITAKSAGERILIICQYSAKLVTTVGPIHRLTVTSFLHYYLCQLFCRHDVGQGCEHFSAPSYSQMIRSPV